jgi:hypothetical protein
MLRDLAESWKDAVYHIEQKTGYMDEGEVRKMVLWRIFLWIVILVGLLGVAWLVSSATDIQLQVAVVNLPGTFGAVLLALAPLRKDINDLHYSSGSPDGVDKDRMPKPIKRDIRRIIDRTAGLLLIATTFLLQILL